MAPEILKNKGYLTYLMINVLNYAQIQIFIDQVYDSRVDLWSVGVILHGNYFSVGFIYLKIIKLIE
jgi:hypothetical protein